MSHHKTYVKIIDPSKSWKTLESSHSDIPRFTVASSMSLWHSNGKHKAPITPTCLSTVFCAAASLSVHSEMRGSTRPWGRGPQGTAGWRPSWKKNISVIILRNHICHMYSCLLKPGTSMGADASASSNNPLGEPRDSKCIFSGRGCGIRSSATSERMVLCFTILHFCSLNGWSIVLCSSISLKQNIPQMRRPLSPSSACLAFVAWLLVLHHSSCICHLKVPPATKN